MPPETPPAPGSMTPAEALFAQYLGELELAPTTDFEAFCSAHPELARELRQLKAEWDAHPFFARLVECRRATPPLLADELRSRFGDDVDPGVSLDGARPESDSGPTSELLQRLSAHAPARSRYTLLGEIGRGGMGAVLKIWDEDLRRTLAMKVVLGKDDPTSHGGTPPVDSRTLGRFLEEAQVTGQLDHPGIVPVHELGLASDGRVYFTMRLVKGVDLRQIYDHVLTGHDGWNPTRALGVLLKVCEAMSYAHDKGVVHRDLKPANIMVGKYGEVYVMDWGLARVLGQQDRHDVRLRPETPTSVSIRTERREERSDTADSPLVTMDGDVVGTPAYMPLEQARGEVEALGPHSDVYAVGAMLYHLLAGQMPFVPRNTRVSAHTVLMRVLEGPPRRLLELAPRAPAELIAICEKAMARDARARYPNMPALAEDLRAYLERRVVRAYETGTWAETKKWVQRNKPLAASLAAAALIAITSIAWISAKNAEVSAKSAEVGDKNAQLNSVNAELGAQARELRVRGLIQDLAAFEALDDTLEHARSQSRPAHEWWLERARKLVDGVKDVAQQEQRTGLSPREQVVNATDWSPGLADAEERLVELRERALPFSEAECDKDRRTYPRAKDLVVQRARLQWLARMLGLEAWLTEAEVEADVDARLSGDVLCAAESLNDYARARVSSGELGERAFSRHFGDEVESLVLARRAVAAASDEQRPVYRQTLARALALTGRFDEALAMEYEALAELEALETQRLDQPKNMAGLIADLAQVERQVARWRGAELARRRTEHASVAQEVAELERESGARRTWRFAESDDQWWHDRLGALVRDLGRLKERIAIAERSVSEPAAAAAWKSAIEAIAASEKYRGVKWPSGERLTPQLGLVPIGPDPASGLWEFSHLASGHVATRADDKTIALEPELGLVFVLLPGGRVPIEEGTTENEVIQDAELTKIDLDPFFLSKYEMTDGLWDRLGGFRRAGERGAESLFPVTGISWDDCTAALSRSVGWLCLPTEAQWEYGCRAGTTTPWWTGKAAASLRGAANIYLGTDDREWTWLQRTGLLRANPFGLHDVHGNVWEWCRDAWTSDGAVRQPGDGFLDEPDASARVLRGGNPWNAAENARSSQRHGNAPGYRYDDRGLRPAVGITP